MTHDGYTNPAEVSTAVPRLRPDATMEDVRAALRARLAYLRYRGALNSLFTNTSAVYYNEANAVAWCIDLIEEVGK